MAAMAAVEVPEDDSTLPTMNRVNKGGDKLPKTGNGKLPTRRGPLKPRRSGAPRQSAPRTTGASGTQSSQAARANGKPHKSMRFKKTRYRTSLEAWAKTVGTVPGSQYNEINMPKNKRQQAVARKHKPKEIPAAFNEPAKLPSSKAAGPRHSPAMRAVGPSLARLKTYTGLGPLGSSGKLQMTMPRPGTSPPASAGRGRAARSASRGTMSSAGQHGDNVNGVPALGVSFGGRSTTNDSVASPHGSHLTSNMSAGGLEAWEHVIDDRKVGTASAKRHNIPPLEIREQASLESSDVSDEDTGAELSTPSPRMGSVSMVAGLSVSSKATSIAEPQDFDSNMAVRINTILSASTSLDALFAQVQQQLDAERKLKAEVEAESRAEGSSKKTGKGKSKKSRKQPPVAKERDAGIERQAAILRNKERVPLGEQLAAVGKASAAQLWDGPVYEGLARLPKITDRVQAAEAVYKFGKPPVFKTQLELRREQNLRNKLGAMLIQTAARGKRSRERMVLFRRIRDAVLSANPQPVFCSTVDLRGSFCVVQAFTDVLPSASVSAGAALGDDPDFADLALRLEAYNVTTMSTASTRVLVKDILSLSDTDANSNYRTPSETLRWFLQRHTRYTEVRPERYQLRVDYEVALAPMGVADRIARKNAEIRDEMGWGRKHERSAARLQALARGREDRLLARELRAIRDAEIRGATKLQSVVRGLRGRKRYDAVRLATLSAAAVRSTRPLFRGGVRLGELFCYVTCFPDVVPIEDDAGPSGDKVVHEALYFAVQDVKSSAIGFTRLAAHVVIALSSSVRAETGSAAEAVRWFMSQHLEATVRSSSELRVRFNPPPPPSVASETETEDEGTDAESGAESDADGTEREDAAQESEQWDSDDEDTW